MRIVCGVLLSVLPLLNDSIAQELSFRELGGKTTGISFMNRVPENASQNIILYPYHYNGGGVAIGDINNDNLQDIYFVSNSGKDALYLNLGDLKFQDISTSSGIDRATGWKTGVTMVDINDDGLLDIYICRSGDRYYSSNSSNILYLNEGSNKFINKAAEYGLDDISYSTQATFTDIDNDGDLDMFLLNHNVKETKTYDVSLGNRFRHPLVGDKLYINDNGYFKNSTEQYGVKGTTVGYGLGVLAADINGDYKQDIYVANDFQERDYLYYNLGSKFEDRLKNEMGHISNFSMGVDINDINNDGLLDVLVVDMVAEDHYRQKTNMKSMDPSTFWKTVRDGQHYQYMMNTLQLNNGNGTFSEISKLSGVSNTDWSWSPLLADFNNDGWKDIFVSNGLRKDVRNNDYVIRLLNYLDSLNTISDSASNREAEIMKALGFIPSTPVVNYFFKNNGDLTFSKSSSKTALASFSTGAAYGDLDNDGDLDLVVNNVDSTSFIYENLGNKNNYLRVRLTGVPGNGHGLGSTITIHHEDGFQKNFVTGTRGFQSGSETIAHFGLGKIGKVDITVTWPDGSQGRVLDVISNQDLILDYATTKTLEARIDANQKDQIFTPIDLGIAIKHNENIYNDFDDQLLLPHRMSTLGPALAVSDVNQDGRDDFYLGGAKGYKGRLFLQQEGGKFKYVSTPAFEKNKSSEELDAHFIDFDSDGDMDLYVVSGGYEFEEGDKDLEDHFYLNDHGKFVDASDLLPDIRVSGGVVKPEDFDMDGDVDLFIGARQAPKNYPYSQKSYLLENKGNRFELMDVKGLEGMVSDALWHDYNNDGWSDLVVVGEWMPITFIKNSSGLQLSKEFALNNSSGWWNCIDKGDFDGDGTVEFVVGNLGKNYKYKANPSKPFKIFANDFDLNGSGDIVLGYYEGESILPVRGRQCSSEQVPFIKDKFPSYHSFASANLIEIYGDKSMKTALELEVKEFRSGMVVNTSSGRFHFEPFDNRVQISPVNDIFYDDFDRDGRLDLVVSGNLFNAEVETPRADAGIGLLMLNKDNKLIAQRVISSGYFTPGDVRKIKKINVNKKNALLVASNDDYLRILSY
ncbi:MAG: VCBS repeat-containing protein [Bacteroidota bacterium]